jgi:hypothetical protein
LVVVGPTVQLRQQEAQTEPIPYFLRLLPSAVVAVARPQPIQPVLLADLVAVRRVLRQLRGERELQTKVTLGELRLHQAQTQAELAAVAVMPLVGREAQQSTHTQMLAVMANQVAYPRFTNTLVAAVEAVGMPTTQVLGMAA